MASIGIDFDGTLVTHAYPDIGHDIGATQVLLDLVRAEHQLWIWTMRSGEMALAALEWCRKEGIQVMGINVNVQQKIWTNSPKLFCNLYIDDAALGCLLKTDPTISDRPFVDWDGIRKLLIEKGYLPSDRS